MGKKTLALLGDFLVLWCFSLNLFLKFLFWISSSAKVPYIEAFHILKSNETSQLIKPPLGVFNSGINVFQILHLLEYYYNQKAVLFVTAG